MSRTFRFCKVARELASFTAFLWIGIIIGITATLSHAQTSYPMLSRVHPIAVQRGQAAEITIGGQGNFAGASSIIFEGKGLAAEVMSEEKTAPKATSKKAKASNSVDAIRVRITAANDAALGPREMRVVTPRGVSSVGQIVVVADPVIVEEDKLNDDPAHPQTIPLPSAVAGVVGKVEDVDWFAFQVEDGQRVTFSLWGNRLEDKIHDLQTHMDPILQLFDSDGRELAANDNHHFADPMLSYEFKKAGTYLIQVRDTTYAGNANWSYVLQATSGPIVTSAFPMAVKSGEAVEIQAEGFNFDTTKAIRMQVPVALERGPVSLTLMTDRGQSQPVLLVATELPLAVESSDTPAEKGQDLGLPLALSGRLGEPNDVDSFKFMAKKGTTYSFEVLARRVGSIADPVLRIVNAKGQKQAEADDTFGKDPRLEWTAPDDGEFGVVIRDLHGRGGAGFGYVLLAEPAKPDFTATCDPDKLNLGPGARTPLFVKIERRAGFNGPVKFRLEGLPAGVSASELAIPANKTQGLIVISAASDAKSAAELVTIKSTAETPAGSIDHDAIPRQEIYLPGGGRGLFSVATLPVAVTEPSDITVEATPAEITLKPGKSATIDVTIARHGGYAGPVNLAMDLSHLGQVFATTLPQGVSIKANGSKTLIAANATSGKIILEAKADAPPCEETTVAVIGHVSINFVVKTAYCSGPIKVRVLPK